MAEKEGYPDGPPPNEPPPSYSPPYPPTGGTYNQAYTPPQYPPPKYGEAQAQYGGAPQAYGGQAQLYGGQPPPYGVSNIVVTQPAVNCNAVHNYAPDNMGLAIFATICCCWPLGIVAILRASEARSAVARGDMNSAALLSNQAKSFALGAIISGLVVIILMIIIIVAVVL